MGFSLPEEFVEDMGQLLGPKLPAFLKCYEQPSLHGLRFRNEEYEAALASDETADLQLQAEDKIPWAPFAYYYNDETKPGSTALHEMGAFYIQEPSAMGPAALLAPEPGERVLDLCAAPGGKTTELASFMEGKGLLIANEIHPARAKILSSNVERMGIPNAVVLNMDSFGLVSHFSGFFHKILVDAPCSGEGMFRKNPEAISEWSRDNVALCAARQLEILENAYFMLLPGGRLCYSTCTFAKEENEDVTETFLAEHPDLHLIEKRRFWPHLDRGEGHYMALIEKDGSLSRTLLPTHSESLPKGRFEIAARFLKEILTDEAYRDMGGDNLKKTGTISFGDQLYLAPAECPSLIGLKVLRAGLQLGEFKKDRFEPSHALALALGRDKVTNSYDLDKEEAERFIRGEGIYLKAQSAECGTEQTSAHGKGTSGTHGGWCLMTYLGFPVGWGKISGGQAKNHYPKGLRKH